MKIVQMFVFFVFVLASSALPQGPVKELEIEISGKPSVSITRPQGQALDVNSDGVVDVPIVSVEEAKFIVKSGNSNQTWEYPITNFTFQKIEWAFIGFYEMNNDSPEKEAIFAKKNGRLFTDPIILNQEAFYNVTFSDIYISSIFDIDDDGIDELQLFNPQTGLLEIWGPGPALELFPQSFSLNNVTIDVHNNLITYNTEVNGEKRDVSYIFLDNNTADIIIQDGNSNILLSFNSSQDFWSLPEVNDEVLVWLVTQNLIKNPSIGLAELWQEYKDKFSEEAQQYASNGLGGIGGIIGLIPALADIFCRANGTASCTDDDGVTVTINCTCGVPTCQTKQVAVTVMIVEVDPNTGSQTTRQEIQYKDKCFCTCLKLKETKE